MQIFQEQKLMTSLERRRQVNHLSTPIKIRPKARPKRSQADVMLEPLPRSVSVSKTRQEHTSCEQHQTFIDFQDSTLQQPPTSIRKERQSQFDYDQQTNFVRPSQRSSNSIPILKLPQTAQYNTDHKRRDSFQSEFDDQFPVPSKLLIREFGSTTASGFRKTTASSFRLNRQLDLSGIHKKLDSEEIKLQSKVNDFSQTSLQQQSTHNMKQVQDQALQKFKINLQGLQDTEKRLACNPQLKDLLCRLAAGFTQSLEGLETSMVETSSQFCKQTQDLTFKLEQQKAEFSEYKQSNDINLLFGKGFDKEQLQKLLKDVQDLQQKTDWHQYDRTLVEMQSAQGQNLKQQLDLISNDLKLNQPLPSCSTLQRGEEPPLSSVGFSTEIRKANHSQLERTIQITSDVSKQFHDKQRKLLRTQGTQSETLEEIFGTLTHHVKYLREEVVKYVAQSNQQQHHYKRLSTTHGDTIKQLYEYKIKLSNEAESTWEYKQLEKTLTAEIEQLQSKLLECQHQHVNQTKELDFVRKKNWKYDNDLQLKTEQLFTIKKEQVRQQNQLKKIQKQNDLISEKLIQIGGQEALDQLIADISTSETEEELITKMSSMGNLHSRRSGSSKSLRLGFDLNSQGTERKLKGNDSSKNYGLTNKGSEEALGDDLSTQRSGAEKQANRKQGPSITYDQVDSDTHKQSSQKRTSQEQKQQQSIQRGRSIKNLSQEPTKKVTFDDPKNKPNRSSTSTISSNDAHDTLNRKKSHDNQDYPNTQSSSSVKRTSSTFKAGFKKQPSTKDSPADTPLTSNETQPKIRRSKTHRSQCHQADDTSSEDDRAGFKVSKVVTQDLECQTDPSLVVQFACDMFLHELALQQKTAHDAQLLLRIKQIVEQILAKSRQAGVQVNQLVGVVLGCPKHNLHFQDMHGNSLLSQKSKHFTIQTEEQQSQQSSFDMINNVQQLKQKFN